MEHQPQVRNLPAGFWQRVSAAIIDLLLLYAVLRLISAFLIITGTYVPFEATYVLMTLTYSIAGLGFRGATIGKLLCGLNVRTVAGARIGLVRAAIRETLGKLLSVIPLGAGLFAAAGRAKRGWHDRVAGTVVLRSSSAHRRSRIGTTAGLCCALVILGLWIAPIGGLYLHVLPIVPTSPGPPRYAGRDPADLLEAALIEESSDNTYVSWLDANALPAADFLVDKCLQYPVVIVGEQHWQKEPLKFLSDVLPRLYHESGVTCIAMEWLLESDNERIDQLLQSDTYDEQLAMEIARHNSWKTWGWKEYLGVLEAAWSLNSTLDPSKPKMRIVGLDLPIDLPSVALAGFSDSAVEAPLWERLRAVRLISNLPKMLLRDAFMARQAERQLLERNERGIVWVGAAHSTINCRRPGPDTGGWGRMGFMLAQKYPRDVYQIVLHGAFANLPGSSKPSSFDQFLDRVMSKRGGAPLGFEVLDSPFDNIRDSRAWAYRSVARMSLGDLACGYLYLEPAGSATRCQWLDGYVTDHMFTQNRAFYVAKGRQLGMAVRNAAEAELALAHQ